MNVQLLMDRAKAAKIEAVEVYIQRKENETIQIYDQKVDNFTIAQSGGIAVRGLYQGKMGYCFLEEDTDDNIDWCIQMIKENASSIESDDLVKIFAGSEQYPTIEKRENQMLSVPTSQKIQFLKELEQRVKESDPRIEQVMTTMMETEKVKTELINSLGLQLVNEDSYCIFYAYALAGEQNDHKSAYELKRLYELNSFDMDQYVNQLKDKVIQKLNAKQVKTGKYPIIIKNEAMSSLLGAFTDLFNGEQVYKGISLLKDRLDEMIFDEKITIYDDPLKADGNASTPFDDEGVASMKKTIVENGQLKMFLQNQKSAMMMHTESTGNGFKHGYASQISIRPTNFYIEPKGSSLKQLCEQMQSGLIIDELNGLHAGLNPISTDFSLQASGFVVENGEIVRPVNLITVAGNFMEMMKQVDGVGSDLYEALSGIGSPSILFHSLAISGE
ncbi:MAG: TldD/PmbA family protein [Erysipelotrichaceae bacterium]|nr:TldD/PmbA family protein [Erysipelotrichaceae bacterium]